MGRGFFLTFDGIAPPESFPRGQWFFILFFAFYFCGCERIFAFRDPKFSAFDRFPCILECCVSFHCFLVRGWVPHPPTHPIESKETKNSTIECKENGQMLKISHQKNVNKSKNHCSPLK